MPGPVTPTADHLRRLLDRPGWRVAILDGHAASGRRDAVAAVMAVAREAGVRVVHHGVLATSATPARVAAALRGQLRGAVPARGRDGLVGLARDLEAAGEPALLVIDDAHRGERTLIDALVALARTAPNGVRLAVGGARRR